MIYITHDEVTELFKTAEVEVKELTAEMLVNDDYTAMKMHRISLKNGIKISSRICETQNNDCDLGRVILYIPEREPIEKWIFIKKDLSNSEYIELLKSVVICMINHLSKEET